MNNKIVPSLLITAVCVQSAFAMGLQSPVALENEFREIAYNLNHFAEIIKTDLCAGDVTIAAAYIESAGRELQSDQHTKALTSLSYGQNELKEINSGRSYCANLAAGVKPYLAQMILLKSLVENLPFPTPDQTSDWVGSVGIY